MVQVCTVIHVGVNPWVKLVREIGTMQPVVRRSGCGSAMVCIRIEPGVEFVTGVCAVWAVVC